MNEVELKLEKQMPQFLNEFWNQEHIQSIWNEAVKTDDLLERYEIIRGIVMKVEETKKIRRTKE